MFIVRVLIVIFVCVSAVDSATWGATTLRAGVTSGLWGRQYHAAIGRFENMRVSTERPGRWTGTLVILEPLTEGMTRGASYPVSCAVGANASHTQPPQEGTSCAVITSPQYDDNANPQPLSVGTLVPTSTFFSFMPEGSPVCPVESDPLVRAKILRVLEIAGVEEPAAKVAAVLKEFDEQLLPLTAALEALDEAIPSDRPDLTPPATAALRKILNDNSIAHGAQLRADRLLCRLEASYRDSAERVQFLEGVIKAESASPTDRQVASQERRRLQQDGKTPPSN